MYFLDVDVCQSGACALENGADTVDAICENSGGQALCNCPDGYNGNAYSGGTCTLTVQCSSNGTSCGEYATCSVQDGLIQCTCESGQFPDGTITMNGPSSTECIQGKCESVNPINK